MSPSNATKTASHVMAHRYLLLLHTRHSLPSSFKQPRLTAARHLPPNPHLPHLSVLNIHSSFLLIPPQHHTHTRDGIISAPELRLHCISSTGFPRSHSLHRHHPPFIPASPPHEWPRSQLTGSTPPPSPVPGPAPPRLRPLCCGKRTQQL